MAAVLCSSVGELCTATCKGFGKVVCLPCKALGMTCDLVNDFLCTPFLPYSVVTFSLHTPALVYFGKSLDNAACPELFRWLMVNALLSAMHMIAALYIVHKIRESAAEQMFVSSATARLSSSKVDGTDNLSKLEEGPTATAVPYNNFSTLQEEQNGGANSLERIKHVLCYDKGMAVYILVIVVWTVWLGMGVTRRFVFDDGNEACDELVGYLNITIACGYMWATMVCFAFCCSLLCLR